MPEFLLETRTPTLKQNGHLACPGVPWDRSVPGISCHAALETTAWAAFSKESRMKFANATNTNRKSGVA
jgi:hypothetical protein